ncbi:hypothetical protein [Catenulispora rubra]|uniref:hypothetical protein n=1 Tax=Catenulispora rubra TaxID=280293 RepID=UPI0018920D6A|nr:hypothetical protein [Catenulispora rubra]
MHYVDEYSKYRRAQIQVRPVQHLYKAACAHLRRAADAGHGDATLELARELSKMGPKPSV